MAITRLTLPLVWHLAFLCVVYLVPAQAMTREQMVEERIGAPVYASDGHVVGEVVDASTRKRRSLASRACVWSPL